VTSILALAENGDRLMPLAESVCCSELARQRIKDSNMRELFPSSYAPRAALAGLYLYFGCREQAHEAAQAESSREGSYWHAIVHRQEPDPENSSYWFRRVGNHPVFSALRDAANRVQAAHPQAALHLPESWDPLEFIKICENARRSPASEVERAAQEIQRAEWQLLFDYCARWSSD